jgi:6-phosphogluconolactonase
MTKGAEKSAPFFFAAPRASCAPPNKAHAFLGLVPRIPRSVVRRIIEGEHRKRAHRARLIPNPGLSLGQRQPILNQVWPRENDVRRHLLAVLMTLPLGLAPVTALARQPAKCTGALLYLGSFAPAPGPGIIGARLDEKTGRLCSLGRVAEIAQPTWMTMHPSKPVLYATRQVAAAPQDQGAFAYAIDAKTGALRLINSAPTGGAAPTYLSADARSNTLFAAHWDSGDFSALPIRKDGGLEAPTSIVKEPDTAPPRPRAHAIERDASGRFVVGAEYGLNRMLTYRFDPAARTLTPAVTLQLPTGSGPRHFVLHPNGKRLYLLNELKAEVQVYGWDAATGALTLEQSVETSAPGFAGRKQSAAIVMSQDARYLYVSNRNEDVIVGFTIDAASGRLTEIQRIASGGRIPRDFAFSPSGRWMLVANQTSNTVNVFARDPATGRLSPTDGVLNTEQPVVVTFLGSVSPGDPGARRK